jgi:hypothetical protein
MHMKMTSRSTYDRREGLGNEKLLVRHTAEQPLQHVAGVCIITNLPLADRESPLVTNK